MADQTHPGATDEAPVVIAAETHVAAFGCPAAGRLFRALVPGKAPRDNTARTLTVARCPGCGGEHCVLHMGRDRQPGESVDVCIGGAVDLGPPPKPTTPLRPKPTPAAEPKANHRQKFTDAELLAALTSEPQRAAAVARALGAKVSSTVIERCDALDGAEVIYQGAGRPTLVRLDRVEVPSNDG